MDGSPDQLKFKVSSLAPEARGQTRPDTGRGYVKLYQPEQSLVLLTTLAEISPTGQLQPSTINTT